MANKTPPYFLESVNDSFNADNSGSLLQQPILDSIDTSGRSQEQPTEPPMLEREDGFEFTTLAPSIPELDGSGTDWSLADSNRPINTPTIVAEAPPASAATPFSTSMNFNVPGDNGQAQPWYSVIDGGNTSSYTQSAGYDQPNPMNLFNGNGNPHRIDTPTPGFPLTPSYQTSMPYYQQATAQHDYVATRPTNPLRLLDHSQDLAYSRLFRGHATSTTDESLGIYGQLRDPIGQYLSPIGVHVHSTRGDVLQKMPRNDQLPIGEFTPKKASGRKKSNKPTITCQVCGMPYVSQKAFYSHWMQHHAGKTFQSGQHPESASTVTWAEAMARGGATEGSNSTTTTASSDQGNEATGTNYGILDLSMKASKSGNGTNGGSSQFHASQTQGQTSIDSPISFIRGTAPKMAGNATNNYVMRPANLKVALLVPSAYLRPKMEHTPITNQGQSVLGQLLADPAATTASSSSKSSKSTDSDCGKAFICSQCSKTYKQRRSWAKHMREVHNSTDTNANEEPATTLTSLPHTCHLCSKRFQTKGGLSCHLTVTHRGNGTP